MVTSFKVREEKRKRVQRPNTHTHTHTHIYIYIYTHTHTHTQPPKSNRCSCLDVLAGVCSISTFQYGCHGSNSSTSPPKSPLLLTSSKLTEALLPSTK